MWESCGFSSLHSDYVAFPQMKNQHWAALDKRRRPEWCTLMLERLGEVKRPHSAAQPSEHEDLLGNG